MEYRLALLGPPEVHRGGQRVAFPHRRGLALLAWLVDQGPRPRTSLAALLWPDAEPARADASLRQCLRLIRHKLPALLDGSRDPLGLRPVATDLEEAGLPDAEQALLRYRGPFCAGLDLPDCEVFQEWLDLQRHRWEARHLRLLVRVADERLQSGRVEAARQAAHRALEMDPWHLRVRDLLRRADQGAR